VTLEGSDANQVVNHDIRAGWQGVLLSSSSKGNKIIAYIPFECPGQGFTLKMTRRGHVSVYGCCGI
jgi:hypothetical protein